LSKKKACREDKPELYSNTPVLLHKIEFCKDHHQLCTVLFFMLSKQIYKLFPIGKEKVGDFQKRVIFKSE